MNHRIVSAVTGVVLLLFAGAALLFALGTTPARAGRPAPGAPPIPHETGEDRAACRNCHAPGGDASVLPPTHRAHAVETCRTCHRSADRRQTTDRDS